MKIYVRKIDNQFIDKQVSYTKEVLREFLDDKKDHETIPCEGKNSKEISDVALLLATDPRFDNNIKKILKAEGDYEVGDIMLMSKLKDKYIIELVKSDTEKYKVLITLFDEKDRHLLLDDAIQTFDFSMSTIKDGQNLIVYGTPGCGKSYYVEHTLLKDYPKENYIRTTFFQDYTNTDFVGQILPVVEGDKVTYEFNPGPFTLALEQAIRKPNENVALVIEELNRGSAASIFGDIFQLLDRKEGVSEYEITNVNILNYLKQQFGGMYVFESIKLPSNLSIFATMNTSDQNVFTLDTAFKRRWKFKKLLNKFESDHTFKDMYIPGADITWEDFVDSINLFILESSNGLNSEDKQLGVYFVNEKLMRKDKNVPAELEKVEAFAYKVLEYLWSDVAKFDRSRWFEDNIKSLDMLVEEYKSKGIGVFKHDIFNK